MSILQQDTDKAREVVKGLYVLQASTFTLMLKSWGVHWNINTENFLTYHILLEDIYKGLIDITDRVAENIGALGYVAPASIEKYLELTVVKDGIETREAKEMLRVILEDLFKIEEVLTKVGEEAIIVKNKAVENMVGEVAESLRVYIYKLRKTVV